MGLCFLKKMKKLFFLSAFALMGMSAQAQRVVTSPVEDEQGAYQFAVEDMADNQSYAAGSDEATSSPVIWDVKTGKLHYFTYEGTYYPPLYDEETFEFLGYDYDNPQPDTYEGSFHAINNEGMAVGEFGSSFADKYPCFAKLGDTEVTYLYADKETEAGGSAYGISADGKTIVGFYFDDAWMTKACVWKNGGKTAADRIDLPAPTAEEFGGEIDYVAARWISADAKVILGYAQDFANGSWVMVYWTLEADGTYKVHADQAKKYYTSYEYDFETGSAAWAHPENLYSNFEPMALSVNGEWVTLNVCPTYDLNDYEAVIENQSARLNLTTGQLEVLKSEDGIYPELYGVANDGTAVGTTSMMWGPMTQKQHPSLSKKAAGRAPGDARTSYVWKAGSKDVVALTDLYEGNSYFNSEELMSEFVMSGITPDAQYICGYRHATDGIDLWEVTSFIAALDGEASVSAITTDAAKPGTFKTLENGQLIITHNGQRFNAMGQRK